MKKLLICSAIILLILLSGCSKCGNKVCDDGEDYLGCPEDCKQTQEYVEMVAQKFGRLWEQKDYSSMYDMFTPELKQMKTKQAFVELLTYKEQESNIMVRLDSANMETKSSAYAYYTITSSLFDSKAPAIKLIYKDNEWVLDAFAPYFLMDIEEEKYKDFLKNHLAGIKEELAHYEKEKINFECYSTDVVELESSKDLINKTPAPSSLSGLKEDYQEMLGDWVRLRFDCFILEMAIFVAERSHEPIDADAADGFGTKLVTLKLAVEDIDAQLNN